MRHARVMGLAGLAIVAVAAVAFAQTNTEAPEAAAAAEVTPVPDNAPVETAPLEIDLAKTTWGDAKAGQTAAAACAACHGIDGNSDNPMYPRIAGQSERYIAHQLALFASGKRNTGLAAVMAPFAQMLSAQDMRNVGAFYATQKSGAGLADDSVVADGGPYDGMKFYEIGQKLYRSGDAGRGIPACLACHGPSGAGNPGPAYPHIGGQMQDYTVRRLQEYQAGMPDLAGDPLVKVMSAVAKPLTEQEIQALASYIQGLHDRADDVAAAP
ncbi:c-type cytochrome [Pseudoxanthomonas mexicana]|uniref:c-type cytochrome n=1 Tax=Pseudoxanthomonas mexicana TaxID=128785 RepID=UPI00398A8E3C